MKWVRPFVTVIAVLGLTVGFFTGRVNAEAYVPLMAGVIMYWFAARDSEKKA
jgi:hypothetical protein